MVLGFPALVACAGPEDDLAQVRAATMAGDPIPWEELDIHPALMRRPCTVSTLVSRDGTPVGYCRDGRHCRTMDWRPVEDACRPAQRSAAWN
ncbi:MAG: hypothetical protein O9325_01540 [Roseomonas sp.]|nr:hypothetical protein [Roseomonas sp.]